MDQTVAHEKARRCNRQVIHGRYGAPDRIRTCDLCLRRTTLYYMFALFSGFVPAFDPFRHLSSAPTDTI